MVGGNTIQKYILRSAEVGCHALPFVTQIEALCGSGSVYAQSHIVAVYKRIICLVGRNPVDYGRFELPLGRKLHFSVCERNFALGKCLR